jgi:hypothetical protein
MEEVESMQYFQAIAMNSQKGDVFRIKFKEDPVSYIGIPVLSKENETRFSLQIYEPEDRKGRIERELEDIEKMEHF